MTVVVISVLVSAVLCTVGVGVLVKLVSRDTQRRKEASNMMHKYDQAAEEQRRNLDLYRSKERW